MMPFAKLVSPLNLKIPIFDPWLLITITRSPIRGSLLVLGTVNGNNQINLGQSTIYLTLNTYWLISYRDTFIYASDTFPRPGPLLTTV